MERFEDRVIHRLQGNREVEEYEALGFGSEISSHLGQYGFNVDPRLQGIQLEERQ